MNRFLSHSLWDANITKLTNQLQNVINSTFLIVSRFFPIFHNYLQHYLPVIHKVAGNHNKGWF